MRSSTKWNLLWLFSLGLAATSGWGAARGAENRNQTEKEPQVVVGQYAPDFNVPRLYITQSPEGKPIGVLDPNHPFHLASLRGKRPVCLIMSSYT